MKYARLIIDNNTDATDELYTYACPDNMEIGRKVYVPFGMHNKLTEAYVAGFEDSAPTGFRIKEIKEADPEVCLREEAVRTALWMRSRCMCRYIEAIKLFLPGNTQARRKTKDIFAGMEYCPDSPKALNPEQSAALKEICSAMDSGSGIYMLNGVTGSGKTEVYLQAMENAIASGRQGIVLVPEISLTPQTVSRFINRFGRDAVAVLHSKLTPAQKSVEYRKIEQGQVKLAIGARSAVFAPFDNIGLIVMDEEHESSYKSDKSPKYDTIEVAAKRAAEHGALLLLGSATPSVTDSYRCRCGIFKEIKLTQRYNKTPLPEIKLVDMRDEIRRGNRSLFSAELADAVDDCLAAGKQVILFLNRRGYSSFVSCRECGYTVKCPDCGIALTYHKDQDAMVCHYCGHKVPMPRVCPKCGSKVIGRFGAGTQQVEEKARELFPQANIERLDLDSIQKKGSLEAVLKRFAQGRTDILIGTQLVAKGLDFSNVGLVGIISADVTLNIPDFRSSERGFQLITQAAGRAGRGTEQGKVIIQSYNPDNPALAAASRQDYEEFYEREIRLRDAAGYPPFMDIFQLVVSHEKEETAARSAAVLHQKLMKELDASDCIVLNAAKAPLNKAGGQFRYQIIVKVPAGSRRAVSEIITRIRKDRSGKDESLLQVDINPYSLL